MAKQEKWTYEMYRICCKKYLYFLKGYYDNIGAGRGVLIKDIIDEIQGSIQIKVNKIEEVDEKLKEIQVIVNEYYPIYKEPVGVAYEPTDECLSAFVSVVDEIENPPQNPIIAEPNINSVGTRVNITYFPAEPIVQKIDKFDIHFKEPVVPKWSDLRVGQHINHGGLGQGKIINLLDNGVVRILDLEFCLQNQSGENYVNSFIWPMVFEKGLLLETEVLLKRLNKND